MRHDLYLLLACLCTGVVADEPEFTRADATLQPVRLQLKWTHQFQFAGYYAAIAQGYYREAGLAVTLIEAAPEQDPVRAVLAGQAEFGVGTSELVLDFARGEPVVVLGVIFQHSPLALLALSQSGIRTVHDLAGRRVMIENNSAELFAYLEREGIPRQRLRLVPHGFTTADLADGRVDAMSVYITDEPYVFASTEVALSLFTPRSAGIDFYGDNLFTTASLLARQPDMVAAFRSASLRGWDYAMAHPEEIIDLILARYPSGKTRAQLLFEYQQMVPLLRTDLVPLGYQYAGRWAHIASIYAEAGMVRPDLPLAGFLYNPNAWHIPTWVWWLGALLLALLLCGFGVTLYVARINGRLREEIARREQTELSLIASRSQYQLIFATTPLPLLLFDRETRIIDLNQAAEQVFGWHRREMIGSDIHLLVPPAEVARVVRVLEQAWDGGVVDGMNHNLTQRGDTILCRWINVAQRDAHGEPVAILSLAEDITETQRIQDELRAANQALRTQINQVEGLQAELRDQTLRDPLTGLYNRRQLHLALTAAMARDGGVPVSLVMIDIDHFKSVNDSFGHQAGDQVLIALARMLATSTRTADIACRYGGEEFTIILPGAVTGVAVERAESWRQAFGALMVETPVGPVQRTLSAGVATWPMHGDTPDQLLGAADQALYRAKLAGRDRVMTAD